jgi:hypothetical protein
VKFSRTLIRRTKRSLSDAYVADAYVAHTRLMRTNPQYQRAFTEAAKRASKRVVAMAPPPLAIPARVFAVAVSLYLSALEMA